MQPTNRNIPIGTRFGKLVTTSLPFSFNQRTHIDCTCDCGSTCRANAGELVRGHKQSCGCFKRWKDLKHGFSGSSEYTIWQGIKGRCLNPTDKNYFRYGGREITVCPEWTESFEAFYRDMGTRPSTQHTIERRDNGAGYNKQNCYWATMKQQGRNRRDNHLLTYNNKTYCMTEWAEITGLSREAIRGRIRLGWTIERALTEPQHPHKVRTISTRALPALPPESRNTP